MIPNGHLVIVYSYYQNHNDFWYLLCHYQIKNVGKDPPSYMEAKGAIEPRMGHWSSYSLIHAILGLHCNIKIDVIYDVQFNVQFDML